MKRIILTSLLILALLAVGSCDTIPPTADPTEAPSEALSKMPISGGVQDPEAGDIDVPGGIIDVTGDAALSDAAKGNMDEAYLDLSFNVLKKLYAGNCNALISPLSVFEALSMTDMGAGSDTDEELRKLLAGLESKEQLLLYNEYLNNRSEGDELRVANSVWFNTKGPGADHLSISKVYQSLLEDSFSAEARFLAFDDAGKKAVNAWVAEKTDNMIKQIIDRFDGDEIMMLINALAFDAKWAQAFDKDKVNENAVFHHEDGTVGYLPLMHSYESYYYCTEDAIGFKKLYEDGKYSFLAFLPKDENVKLEDFLNNLDSDTFQKLTASEDKTKVYIGLPALSLDCSTELIPVLQELGIQKSFDPYEADFHAMVDGETDDDHLYIGRIIHKTHVEVNTDGTKAAAVTAVIMKNEATSIVKKESPTVILDRPFVYAIMNEETGLPVFLGTFSEFKEFN